MNETFQEQVTQLRRKQISEAAIQVFADRGFHRTTIRDVAKSAGVSDGTIYNYFENKVALLLSLLDPLSQGSSPPPPLPQATDIRQFFRDHFASRWAVFDDESFNRLRVILSEVLVNPELCNLYVERVLMPPVTLAEPFFQELVAAGTLNAMDVRLTLRAIAGMFVGLVMMRLMGDAYLQEQWETVPERLTTLLLDGMLPKQPVGAPNQLP